MAWYRCHTSRLPHSGKRLGWTSVISSFLGPRLVVEAFPDTCKTEVNACCQSAPLSNAGLRDGKKHVGNEPNDSPGRLKHKPLTFTFPANDCDVESPSTANFDLTCTPSAVELSPAERKWTGAGSFRGVLANCAVDS